MVVRIENQAEPIPGYRLIERIGGGGFGEVWKCEAPGGLHKAIKFVFGDLGAAGDDGHRAEQELKALSRVKTVRHPYILSLERYDIIDGQLIIVMELADRNLWDRYKECRTQGFPGIPREELLSYMEETAEALDLMNGQYQLQHLDIKPQNLFLVHQHVKVADFGLVKDLEGMKASVTGGVTPVYASPETFDGYVSRYSDQYSLAIVYQELLTGVRPFHGSNIRQLILQHLQAVPDVSALPLAEQPIIARALSKNPNDRHPNCLTLVQLLRQAQQAAQKDAEAPVAPSSVRLPSTPTAELSTPEAGPYTTQHAPTASIRKPADSHPGTATCLRGLEEAACPPNERLTAQAPQEARGEGVLFPALVLGIGQVGQLVVQQLRQALHNGLGSAEAAPHLRLLALDTDPEAVRQAARAPKDAPEARLPPKDVLLVGLNRPSYYIKSRETLAALEKWLKPRMLYRIPRSQVTTGVRALGRLALCDNYRAIRARLKREIEALLEPQALAAAARQTRLGVSTNRPRVYLVCGVSGGTGGGMFLDLAYTVRALLREVGFEEPEVAGLLFLPPLEGSQTRVAALGNAYAALSELRYYARPGTLFSARYHDMEPPVEDTEPPFRPCVLLPLPEETDQAAVRETMAQAGQYLFHELCSPLGKVAEQARRSHAGSAGVARGQAYQTFGLFQITWPRRKLLETVGRRLCSQLVERWMSKDNKPVREGVQSWVQERWARHELGADVFLNRLREDCATLLAQDPETAYKEALQPTVDKYAPPRASSKAAAAKCLDMAPEDLADALKRLEEVLGTPPEDNAPEPRGSLVQLLREVGADLRSRWGQKVAEIPVQLIEEPDFRLAGAEEAVRQMVAMIEQILQRHEPLCKDLVTNAREAHERLRAFAYAPANPPRPDDGSGLVRRRPPMPPAADVVDLLRTYAKWRFQGLVLTQVTSAFVTLRGHLADEMREINSCRIRLGELLSMFGDPTEGSAHGTLRPTSRTPTGPPQGRPPSDVLPRSVSQTARLILPAGYKDVAGAAAGLLARLGADALRELDGKVEAMLKEHYVALVHVCLSEANVLTQVSRSMLDTARAFLEGQMAPTDVAAMFFEQHPDAGQALQEINDAFETAAPEPLWRKGSATGTVPDVSEVCILMTPPGEEGERFRTLAEEAVVGTKLHSTSGGPNPGDDIVIYRETSNLPLAQLRHLGPAAWDAYAQMSGADHFTPHSRQDLDFNTGK
jgi:hypothetical protein